MLPIILGFIIPVGVLLSFVLRDVATAAPDFSPMGIGDAITNTLMIAGISSVIIVMVALVIGILAEYRSGRIGSSPYQRQAMPCPGRSLLSVFWICAGNR